MLTRFVILHHTGIAEPHFDLMFETSAGSALATWRSAGWPIAEPAAVTRLGDHRAAYLDYQGPVGNNRGEVARVGSGTFVAISQSPARWHLRFNDGMELVLVRIEGDRWMATASSS